MKHLKMIKMLAILLIIYLLITFFVLPIKVIANSETQSIIKELVNSQIDDTIDKINQENVDKKPLAIYPVGSIYMSTSSTNPSNFIGGTWEAYGQGRILVGVGTNGGYTFTAGSTGTTIGEKTNPLGEYTHVLTANEIASHTHSATTTGSVSSTFTGESVTTSSVGDHTHTISGSTNSAGSHTHDFSQGGKAIVMDANTSVADAGPGFLVNNGAGWYNGHKKNASYIYYGGSHTHTFTLSGTSAASHTHILAFRGTVQSTFSGSSVTSSLVGGFKAHNNMQSYVVTYIWKRIA